MLVVSVPTVANVSYVCLISNIFGATSSGGTAEFISALW